MRTPTYKPMIRAVYDPSLHRFHKVFVNLHVTDRDSDISYLRHGTLLRNIAAEFNARTEAYDQYNYCLAVCASPNRPEEKEQ